MNPRTNTNATVPLRLIEACEVWIGTAAHAGIQTHYADGSETPNRIALLKLADELRLTLHVIRSGEQPGGPEETGWREVAHEAFLQLEYLHQRERKHSSTEAVLLRMSDLLGVPLETNPLAPQPEAGKERATPYDIAADAVQEVADAAAEAFRKAGVEPNEWDGDDIVRDVKCGIASDIERLARLRDASLYEVLHVAWHFLESGEERVSDSEVAFDLPNADYDKLCELVGESHPESDATEGPAK